MLVNFSASNWKSMRNEVYISSIAGEYDTRSEAIPELGKYNSKLVPYISIYGANASGKSNLIDAISFAREFIVEGVRTKTAIPTKPFLLDKVSEKRPSSFMFEVLINETVYRYEFAVNECEVLYEKLTDLSDYENVKEMFSRTQNREEFKVSDDLDSELLKFAFRTTRDNQLFLNRLVLSNIESYAHIYDWFENSLVIVTPKLTLGHLNLQADERFLISKQMSQLLGYLDTGIVEYKNIEVPTQSGQRIFPPNIVKSKSINEGEAQVQDFGDQRYTITRKNGSTILTELVLQHRKIEGDLVPFNLHMESNGTKRLIDILPVLIALTMNTKECANSKVLVLDELDRSLHSILTKSLINSFLNQCSKESRSQLICTTHDLLLMDLNLLRPDELWIAERDNDDVSSIYSLSQFNELKGNGDIRKFYEAGKFGGIPQILHKDIIFDDSINQ